MVKLFSILLVGFVSLCAEINVIVKPLPFRLTVKSNLVTEAIIRLPCTETEGILWLHGEPIQIPTGLSYKQELIASTVWKGKDFNILKLRFDGEIPASTEVEIKGKRYKIPSYHSPIFIGQVKPYGNSYIGIEYNFTGTLKDSIINLGSIGIRTLTNEDFYNNNILLGTKATQWIKELKKIYEINDTTGLLIDTSEIFPVVTGMAPSQMLDASWWVIPKYREVLRVHGVSKKELPLNLYVQNLLLGSSGVNTILRWGDESTIYLKDRPFSYIRRFTLTGAWYADNIILPNLIVKEDDAPGGFEAWFKYELLKLQSTIAITTTNATKAYYLTLYKPHEPGLIWLDTLDPDSSMTGNSTVNVQIGEKLLTEAIENLPVLLTIE